MAATVPFPVTPGNEVISLPLAELWTPRDNDRIYGRIVEDEGIRELAKSISRNGLLEPIVVNREGAVISGKRRMNAARLAGLQEVPCRVVDVREGAEEFRKMLVAFNRDTRNKTLPQIAREDAATMDPNAAFQWVIEEREARKREAAEAMQLPPAKRRKAIVDNRPLADAAIKIINGHAGFKMTLRQLHYVLLKLKNPPLVNSRTGRRYRNDDKCYHTLSGVVSRLRVFGELPFDCLADLNRFMTEPYWYKSMNDYAQKWLRDFRGGYYHDMMQGQSSCFVVFVEKQTQQALFLEFMENYPGIPLEVCRGQNSITATGRICKYFRESGKDRLVLIGMTDCDPAGYSIAATVGNQLREMGLTEGEDGDFQIIRAGLTPEQARAHGACGLPVKANEKGGGKTKAGAWMKDHGRLAFELESIPQDALLSILREVIEGVIDMDAFNRDKEQANRECRRLHALARWMKANVPLEICQ